MVGDLIGLLVILAFLAAAVVGLRILSKPRASTEEEFEKRASEGTSLASAGFQAVNGLLNPSADKGSKAVAEIKEGSFQKRKNEGKGLGDNNRGGK
ncbi:MAG: hypothetical protein OEM82_15590 [Acidobacteriota bacterium]|nr:hypothetical protein [Acidobacteriota bacterium]MDH3530670.1 hypothetical protein [Acidobacteriota bacterium]